MSTLPVLVMLLPLVASSLVVLPIALGRVRRRHPKLHVVADLLMLPVLLFAFNISIFEGLRHVSGALTTSYFWAYCLFLAVQPVGMYVCGRVFRDGNVSLVGSSPPEDAKAPASKPNTRTPHDPDPRS